MKGWLYGMKKSRGVDGAYACLPTARSSHPKALDLLAAARRAHKESLIFCAAGLRVERRK